MSTITFICTLILLALVIRALLARLGETRGMDRAERVSAFADVIEDALNGVADFADKTYGRAAELGSGARAKLPSRDKGGHRLGLGEDGQLTLTLLVGKSTITLEQSGGMVSATVKRGDKSKGLTPQEFSSTLEALRMQGLVNDDQIKATEQFLRHVTRN